MEGNRQGVASTGVAPHLPILYRYRAIAELRILPLADGQRSARRIAHRSSRPRPLGDLRNLTRQFTTVSFALHNNGIYQFHRSEKGNAKKRNFRIRNHTAVFRSRPLRQPQAQKSLIIPTARISYPAPWNSAASRRRQHLQPQQRYSRHCSPVVNTNATSCRRYNPLP